LLPKGTAYITDLGLTGPVDSVIGVDPEAAIGRFLTQMPNRFEPAKGPAALHGAVIRIDPDTGRGLSIERLSVPLPA
jgi:2',3'-cyclic-nucleotide 2'-phosphodiesterase